MLSKRLNSLVKYLEQNDKAIDIGCDHALLDIFLINNNILKHIIVSDIHENALYAGIKNIKKHKLEDKIDARLGNGLSVLNECDNINTIIISGMGTSTILDILDNEHIGNINKLILQSNNNHFELRDKITKMGFYIDNEEYLVDNKKNYINIVFKKGSKKYKTDEIKYGPILLKNKEYLEFEINNCLKIQNLIKKPRLKQKLALKREIKKLNKYKKKVEI